MTNAEIVKSIAKRCVDRNNTCGIKGKKRDDLALGLFVGAAACAEAQGNDDLTQHLLRVAVMLVAPRGFKAVEEMATRE